MVRAVRGDLDDLSAQAPHQRGIFAHRVNDDDAVVGGEEHIDQLTLGGEALAAARRAEIHSVGGLQLFAVSHDDIVGKSVHAVVKRLPVHAKLPGHKGNEDGRGAGSHAPLNFNAVVAESQRGHKALLLLPFQTAQSAVIFLRDAAHREHIVFKALPGGSEVHHRKGQQEHSLVAALQVGEQLGGVLGKGNEVGRQNLHVVPGTDGLFLFLCFHAAYVGNFSLDRLNGLELVYRLNVHSDGQFGVQLQNLRQQFIRKLRRHDLQVGRRAPHLADTESPALSEVEAVRGDVVLCPHARLGNVFPRKAERLTPAGVHLPVQHRQPIPTVQRAGLDAQPFQIAHDIRLHAPQPWTRLRHAPGGQAKGNVLVPLNAVVALGDLAFEHFHILAPDAVEVILLRRDIHLVAVGVAAAAVDKGKLERQRAVKIIQARAPPADNGSLILRGRHGIIDVLIFQRLCVKPAGELADAVRVHGDIGNGLLGGQRPVLICFFLLFCFAQ